MSFRYFTAKILSFIYFRFFTGYIYQFQFYQAMCLAAGRTKMLFRRFLHMILTTCSTVSPAGQYVKGDPSKPLHQCNLYGSKRAGEKLGEMLKMGKSRPWKEVTS